MPGVKRFWRSTSYFSRSSFAGRFEIYRQSWTQSRAPRLRFNIQRELDEKFRLIRSATYVSAMHWNELTTSSGPFEEKKLS